MSTRAKREYVAAIYERYRQAGRVGKGHILSEFCAVTGYHRKAAIRPLNHPAPGRRAAGPAAATALCGVDDRGGARDLDGGRLSLVGAPQGLAPAVAAVGAPAIAAAPAHRAAIGEHLGAADRSAPGAVSPRAGQAV